MADFQGRSVNRRALLAGSAASLIVPFVATLTSLPARTGVPLRASSPNQRETVSVKDFGVIADGETDNAEALQRAIDEIAVTGRDLDIGEGTILLGSEIDGTALANNKLFGSATIKARSGTDFMYLLDISGTTGVTIEGLTFDANKDGRGRTAKGRLSCLKANATVLNVLDRITCKNTLGVAGPTSSVAISASGGVSGLYARGLRFLELGTDANTKPSDGLFVRGDQCTIVDTYGENVTDHIVVLEGCNRSTVKNTTGRDCTSFVAISNDTDADVTGNVIDGVFGTCNYFGSFGAIVGVYSFGAGLVREFIVTNVSVSGANGARGGGPALFFSGKVEGQITNITVHPGASIGVMHHAILIDRSAVGGRLRIIRSDLEADPNGTCIRLLGRSNNIEITNTRLRHGTHGVFADGGTSFTQTGNTFSGQTVREVGVGGSAETVK